MGFRFKEGVPQHIKDWFYANQEIMRHEIFTHIDEIDGTIRHFDATALMLAFLRSLKVGSPIGSPCDVPLDEQNYEFIMTRRGIEEHKVARLCEPYLSLPVLVCDFQHHGTQLTVDGHHRMVKLYRTGHKKARGVIFAPSVWEKHLVHMPPEIENHIKESLGL